MKDSQLIFLISQPRSGSSLSQQLLLNSNEIVSCPEPWLMLSLIHTFKQTGNMNGYNPKQTIVNYLNYLDVVDGGLNIYKKKIKKLALEIYSFKVEDDNYFLDKTPRYYHIIEELYDLFPNAKFIFLVRNPLSVFSSILDYNFKGNYIRFLRSNDRIDDLFLAPQHIKKAILNHDNHIVMKYEDLVANPNNELRKLFEYLSLDMPENADAYNVEDDFHKTNSIDLKSLAKHTQTSDKYIGSWKKTIDSTQKKRLALDYLVQLQNQHKDYFGYDLKRIENQIRAHKPLKNSIFNLNFEVLAKNDEELTFFELIKKRLMLKFQKK